jgi:hypothetical protein
MPRDETDSSVATHSSWPYLEPQPFRHLMIIHHSDLSRVTAVPSKYETPLIIEPPSPARLTQVLGLRQRLQALGSNRGVCSCQLAMRREVLQAASPRRLTGEINKSAEIWNRSRSLRTMDMLSSRLPVNTSLTRLGVPRSGTRSARDRPCWSIR